MATKFDPYHEWLGIPPAEQPATHYRLLGLKPFENDPSAVQSAAERQLVHVKTFQLGKQKLECQKLLNELTAAKLVLLDPNRRGAYDVVLRSAAPASASRGSAVVPAAGSAAQPDRAQPADTDRRASGRFVFAGWHAGQVPHSGDVGRQPSRPNAQGAASRHGAILLLEIRAPRIAGQYRGGQTLRARECQILTRLDHPNLIVGHETFEHDRMRFLVMEYVMGTDLATLVKQQGPLAVDQAVDYLLQAARAGPAAQSRHLSPQSQAARAAGRFAGPAADHQPAVGQDRRAERAAGRRADHDGRSDGQSGLHATRAGDRRARPTPAATSMPWAARCFTCCWGGLPSWPRGPCKKCSPISKRRPPRCWPCAARRPGGSTRRFKRCWPRTPTRGIRTPIS